MIKKLFVFFLLMLISLATGKGLYYTKDGFSSRRILPLKNQSIAIFTEEANEALTQTFHYLGRGRQCFAFASDDGKYVLKFPRTDIYQTPFWAKVLPVSQYRKKLEASHKRQEQFIFNSFQISFEELQKQTGTLAIHLGQSVSNQYLTVIDRLGSKHSIPLSTTCFVLQHKHPILMRAFAQAIENKDQKQAEKILDALLSAIVERASKGILNRDRSFLRNYGFDGEKAYQIDIGSFFKEPTLSSDEAFQKSIRDSTDPIKEWLSANCPEMLSYFNSKLNIIF